MVGVEGSPTCGDCGVIVVHVVATREVTGAHARIAENHPPHRHRDRPLDYGGVFVPPDYSALLSPDRPLITSDRGTTPPPPIPWPEFSALVLALPTTPLKCACDGYGGGVTSFPRKLFPNQITILLAFPLRFPLNQHDTFYSILPNILIHFYITYIFYLKNYFHEKQIANQTLLDK